MTIELSPETPIASLFVSPELLAFAGDNGFENIKKMLTTGFNQLHNFKGFDYRLQREIIDLVQRHHWENLLEPE